MSGLKFNEFEFLSEKELERVSRETLAYWSDSVPVLNNGYDQEHIIAPVELENNPNVLGFERDFDKDGRLLGIDGLPV